MEVLKEQPADNVLATPFTSILAETSRHWESLRERDRSASEKVHAAMQADGSLQKRVAEAEVAARKLEDALKNVRHEEDRIMQRQDVRAFVEELDKVHQEKTKHVGALKSAVAKECARIEQESGTRAEKQKKVADLIRQALGVVIGKQGLQSEPLVLTLQM